jgi:hypothetical protein
MVVRIPNYPPPQRPHYPYDSGASMTRTEWRQWQGGLVEDNAAYQAVHPAWTPPPPTVAEPAPNLWERIAERFGW